MIFDIDPVAKGRPRLARNGHTYTPQKTQDAEESLKKLMRYSPQCPKEPLKRALCVQIVFWVEMPKSWSLKKRGAFKSTLHIQRPDLDNLVKTVCDAANEILWEDDSQIAILEVKKFWGEKGSIELEVKEITNKL